MLSAMPDEPSRRSGRVDSVLDGALGVLGQLSARLRAGADRVLDRIEDPEETLAFGRRRMLDRLERLRRAVAGVAEAERALALQVAAVNDELAATRGRLGGTVGGARPGTVGEARRVPTRRREPSPR